MTTTALTHSMTEDQLLTAITEAATLYGWRWHHVRRSDKALQQGHPGFPDLVLARAGHVVFVEVKGPKGRLTEDQREWLTTIAFGEDHDSYVAWPGHLDDILGWLK